MGGEIIEQNLVQWRDLEIPSKARRSRYTQSIAAAAGFPHRVAVFDDQSPRREVCSWASQHLRHRFTFIPWIDRPTNRQGTAYYCEDEADAVNLKLRWC